LRKLTLAMLVSLDGYIEGKTGDLSWFLPESEFFDLYGSAFMARFDTIVLGGKAFVLFSKHWPTSEQPNAAVMNSCRKVAIGKTVQDTGWANSEIARGDLSETIGRLKAEEGRDLVCFGGAKLGRSLVRRGLVDELHLVICPALLGAGTPLFIGEMPRKNFKLIETKAYKSGGVLLRYVPV